MKEIIKLSEKSFNNIETNKEKPVYNNIIQIKTKNENEIVRNEKEVVKNRNNIVKNENKEKKKKYKGFPFCCFTINEDNSFDDD